MDADLIHAILAAACIAWGIYALAAVAFRRADWFTAAWTALAASTWLILTGSPMWVYMLGSAVAFACLMCDLRDEDAEIEAMES
jgi:hypothetical protein